MTVRCKFTCTSMSKMVGWGGHPFLYGYEMQAVTGDSPENKQFYGSTPSGSFKVGAVRDDLFEPGKSYYFDITPAEPAPAA